MFSRSILCVWMWLLQRHMCMCICGWLKHKFSQKVARWYWLLMLGTRGGIWNHLLLVDCWCWWLAFLLQGNSSSCPWRNMLAIVHTVQAVKHVVCLCNLITQILLKYIKDFHLQIYTYSHKAYLCNLQYTECFCMEDAMLIRPSFISKTVTWHQPVCTTKHSTTADESKLLLYCESCCYVPARSRPISIYIVCSVLTQNWRIHICNAYTKHVKHLFCT